MTEVLSRAVEEHIRQRKHTFISIAHGNPIRYTYAVALTPSVISAWERGDTWASKNIAGPYIVRCYARKYVSKSIETVATGGPLL